MKLCSYIIKNDTGFAPNPFWGYCTLAACTPNHMGLHLYPGDWIIGTESVVKCKLHSECPLTNITEIEDLRRKYRL
jgi:hypothetical protein